MTAPPTYGPARAQGSGIVEIEDLRRRMASLERSFDEALRLLGNAVRQRVDDELATWGDVPERIARVEDLLAPMTVDPTTPEVEWQYRRPGDGVLTPAPTDPHERLALITAGVPLLATVRRPREDGRLPLLPHPEMAGG